MWKYVAFVLLIVFSAAAVLGQSDQKNETVVESTIAANESSTNEPTTTTTEAPTTHTESPTTHTDAPTTTAAPTTTNKVTTVPPHSTTALPPPDVGKYSLQETGVKNNTCLRVEMALRVSIEDLQTSYNFPTNASTIGSSCNVSNTEVLKLTAVDPKQSLTFVFVQEDNKNYVQDIIYSYSAPETKTVNTSGHFFSATMKNSYLCHSDVTVKMENVTLTFSSLHIQAFGADSFGRAEECGADDKVGDIVPIAVGCALGALVIIVLIAYLVGRRRSHQKGYQSV